MLNNKNNILIHLRTLGLDSDEAKLYLALLEKPDSHLELARRTKINRTKIYRLADSLITRGLIVEQHDDAGRRLSANSPSHLEIQLKTEESSLANKKATLQHTLPLLEDMYVHPKSDAGVEVNTYDGSDGFKQMLWNELRTRDELLVFGSGTLEDLVSSKRWAEKHRQKTVEVGYKIREILNPDGKPHEFTSNNEFVEQAYQRRHIDSSVLRLSSQLCIYNNTVAFYHWRDGHKVGVEIINKPFADMQRDVFESFWKISKEV